MLLQGAQRPGWLIGVNGFAGNLGVALAAVVTGYLVKHVGWRMAFALPGIVSVICGNTYWLTSTEESTPPLNPQMTRALPTCERMSATVCST